ncbi:MAG: UDP-glucose/GDP-mannose dehydrogenase family protein [Acidimicrobiia bacterium]
MSRTIIVGSGVVGTATGFGLQDKGHAVQFVDTNARRVEQLRCDGHAASTTIDLSGASAFVFVTVPTPNIGNRYELSALRAASEAIGVALRGAQAFHTVVVRSTVPPGTCEHLVTPLIEEASGQHAPGSFAIASNPEFLRAKCAREDFLMPRLSVVGARSARTVERLVELYSDFGGEIRTFTDPAQAEFVKCAHNLYNATKISFWNEMWHVASESRVELDEVAAAVAASCEASFNPAYGIRAGSPYGGACLPKDTRGFLGFAQELGVDMPLLRGVIEVNESLEAISAQVAMESDDARPGLVDAVGSSEVRTA